MEAKHLQNFLNNPRKPLLHMQGNINLSLSNKNDYNEPKFLYLYK